MLGSIGVADEGMELCRFTVDAVPTGLQYLKCILVVIFLEGGMSTNFRINFGADFVPCIKLGVLSLHASSWGGGAGAPTAPGSYIPALR